MLFVLSIRIPSHLVDVNVHPQKAEVRFWKRRRRVPRRISRHLYCAALRRSCPYFSQRSVAEPIRKTRQTSSDRRRPCRRSKERSVFVCRETDTIIAGTRDKENILYTDRKKGSAAYPVQSFLSVKEYIPLTITAEPVQAAAVNTLAAEEPAGLPEKNTLSPSDLSRETASGSRGIRPNPFRLSALR